MSSIVPIQYSKFWSSFCIQCSCCRDQYYEGSREYQNAKVFVDCWKDVARILCGPCFESYETGQPHCQGCWRSRKRYCDWMISCLVGTRSEMETVLENKIPCAALRFLVAMYMDVSWVALFDPTTAKMDEGVFRVPKRLLPSSWFPHVPTSSRKRRTRRTKLLLQ